VRDIENDTKRREGGGGNGRRVVEVRQYQTRPRNFGVRWVLVGKKQIKRKITKKLPKTGVM
jgi:hypothetical protein